MWSQCNLNLIQLWFKMNKDELQSRWIWLTFTFFLPNTSPYQKPNGHTERRKTLCYADDLQTSLYLQKFDFYISIWNLSKIIKKSQHSPRNRCVGGGCHPGVKHNQEEAPAHCSALFLFINSATIRSTDLRQPLKSLYAKKKKKKTRKTKMNLVPSKNV